MQNTDNAQFDKDEFIQTVATWLNAYRNLVHDQSEVKPMTKQLAEVMLSMMLDEKASGDTPLPQDMIDGLKSYFPHQVAVNRFSAEHYRFTWSNRTLLFVSFAAPVVGNLVMALTYLSFEASRKGKDKCGMLDFADHIPWGMPSSDSDKLGAVWDMQKNSKGGNTLDDLGRLVSYRDEIIAAADAKSAAVQG